MTKTSIKIIGALLVLLAAPAASNARMAGEAGMGNIPISGIPPGPANPGGMNNVIVDPSGIANASRMAPLPPPRITVPTIPQFKWHTAATAPRHGKAPTWSGLCCTAYTRARLALNNRGKRFQWPRQRLLLRGSA